MPRVLTVTKARSIYLKTLADSKLPVASEQERLHVQKELKAAQRVLQQAQMHERIRGGSTRRISRPTDWNEELS